MSCVYISCYSQKKNCLIALLINIAISKLHAASFLNLTKPMLVAICTEMIWVNMKPSIKTISIWETKKAHDNKIKEMMFLRITETIKLKSITNYRIYTTLNLNPGNANAFLKNGDISKVSLDTTRRILQFVNEYWYSYTTMADA